MPQARHLFTLASFLTQGAVILCIGVIGLLAIGLGGILAGEFGLFHLPIPSEYLEGMDLRIVLAAAALVIVGAVICVVLSALALLQVGRILDSARTGDPFVEANAARLGRIGWLLLGVQGVSLVSGAVLAKFPDKITQHVHSGFEVSFTGLFAVLLVFVLAQIFRQGSAMRAELEGTV